MNIKALSDIMMLPEKRDVLRVHLYSNLIQYGIKPFENDIDIILELYMFGGYHNTEEQSIFIDTCVSKGLKKSPQSLRNTLSRYTTIGVLDKPRNVTLSVNDKFLPTVECDKLVLNHKVTHAK